VTKACPNELWDYRTAVDPAILRNANKAFTLIELLVVIAISAILLAIFLPMRNIPDRTKLAACMSNLRQVSLGCILWANANTNLFPWEVSTNANGTKELIENGNAADHFTPLATFLRNPAVLVCPVDRAKRLVNAYADFSNSNLSYFISLNASLTCPTNPSFSILAGDRLMGLAGRPVPPGIFEITNFNGLRWASGFHGVPKNPAGVLVFIDGHCEVVTSPNLPATFQRQTLITNRLVIP
jgi:prepilin-type N-terminal cleavage/methylation domain-containing protein